MKMKTVDIETIARALDGAVENISDRGNFALTGFAPVQNAAEDEISFFVGNAVSGDLRNSKAGLVLVSREFSGMPESVGALLRVKNPYAAMVRVVDEFYRPFVEYPLAKIASSARVHPRAVVEGLVAENAFVGPGSVVMRGASVGEGCVLEANVVLYPNVSVGKNCVFQAGVVVGGRGFGFYFDEGVRRPVPHVSGVRIGDGCSFGANAVVAAGFLAPTIIGNDCHFDSFVQIGHNCRLGNGIYMASQSGLGGTTIVEDGAEFAGGAQIAGHLTIGRGAVIAAKAGVTKSVPAGAVYAGFPSEPIDRWRRGVVMLRRLSEGKKRE